MTELEVLKKKVEIQKQWLWMLMNMSDEELALPKGQTKQKAIDKSLERLKQLLELIRKLQQ